jgi:hypothetical protein
LLGVLVGAVAVGGGLALAGGDDGSVGGRAPFMGMSDPRAPYDLRFIDEMTMHHRGAVMSARMMIGDSRRPELRGLARRITADQERQIKQMAAWRSQWYPTAEAPAMGMHGGMGEMGGMERMPGDASDRMFLRMMIPHHALAVDMGKDAVSNASHPSSGISLKRSSTARRARLRRWRAISSAGTARTAPEGPRSRWRR